jgi:hypothetical protein
MVCAHGSTSARNLTIPERLSLRRTSGFRSTGMQGLIAAPTALMTAVAAIDADMRLMAMPRRPGAG